MGFRERHSQGKFLNRSEKVLYINTFRSGSFLKLDNRAGRGPSQYQYHTFNHFQGCTIGNRGGSNIFRVDLKIFCK